MTDSIAIPGYRIVQKLGDGGMAVVYLAIQGNFEHRGLQRKVALKVMSPLDSSSAERFLREARIVADMSHASIVPVFDVGHHGGHHYLVMEYLPGSDLKQRIRKGERGLALARNVCFAIAAALNAAHAKGIVHRDIKSANILFRADDTPVLTDFGIARSMETDSQRTRIGRTVTTKKMLIGTLEYMSPEQVECKELDERSDLYSLGVVFYEALTGALPYRADNSAALIKQQLDEPPPRLPAQYATYQPFLDRLMAKQRADRFETGAEVIRALQMAGEFKRARAWLPVAAGVSVTFAFAAAAGVYVWPKLRQPTAVAALSPAGGAELQQARLQPVETKNQEASDGSLERDTGPASPRPDVADEFASGAGPESPDTSQPDKTAARPRESRQPDRGATPRGPLVEPGTRGKAPAPPITTPPGGSLEPNKSEAPAGPVVAGGSLVDAVGNPPNSTPPGATGPQPITAATSEKFATMFVEQELGKARTNLQLGHLWHPPAKNAAHIYSKLMDSSADARDRFESILAVLVDEAKSELAVRNIKNADELIETLQILSPGHCALTPLRQRKGELLEQRDLPKGFSTIGGFVESVGNFLESYTGSPIGIAEAKSHIYNANKLLDRPTITAATIEDVWNEYNAAKREAQRLPEKRVPGLSLLRARLAASLPSAKESERRSKRKLQRLDQLEELLKPQTMEPPCGNNLGTASAINGDP